MDPGKVYRQCDVCGGPLNEKALEENARRENYTFPVCTKCLEAALSRGEKVLRRARRLSSGDADE